MTAIRKQLRNCLRSSWDLRWQSALPESERNRSVGIFCGCGKKCELWVTFGMGCLGLSCLKFGCAVFWC